MCGIAGTQRGTGRPWARRLLAAGGRTMLALALTLAGVGSAAALDANSATQAELEELRGIGPAISARIIAERTANGAFRDMDDLRERVRGIGVASQKKLAAAGLQVLGGPARGARAGTASVPGESGAVLRQAWMGRSGVVYYDPGPAVPARNARR